MSIHSICGYIYTLALSILLASVSSPVYAQADTTATDTMKAKKTPAELPGHQLCIGVDIFRPILHNLQTDRYSYEVAVDYYARNEYYLVAEGGYGGCEVNYTDLKYTTQNTFLRLGFNKSVLARNSVKDWDMMLIGFRVAASDINRSSANYVVTDSLWGNEAGTSSAKSFAALWAELTGGMRVELVKGLCAGWNLRAKFLMNGKSFKDLSPLYIAGYGKGDKNSIFDFNVYVSYAIRWKRAGQIKGK